MSNLSGSSKPFMKSMGAGAEQQRVFMFGRVRSRQGSGRMSWFATYSGSQQGTVRITFSHDHLNHDRHDFIEGLLTNRPSWLNTGESFDVAGAPVVLQQIAQPVGPDPEPPPDGDANGGQQTIPQAKVTHSIRGKLPEL